MSAQIERVEGLKFRANVGGFEIITGRVNDEKPPVGMPAGAVLFAALGLCTGTRIVEQMKNRNWDVGDVRLVVKPKVSKDMNRVTSFQVDIELDADLTEEQCQEILLESERCFVSNTIKNPPEINVNLKLV